jgi:hypothetical protein
VRRTGEERVEMVPKYTLQSDEWVVLESEPGAHVLAPKGLLRQPLNTTTQTIVLTNRNMILVSTGITGRSKGARYFPLNQIKIANGHPQIVTNSRAGSNLLEIHFQSGVETFAFRRKKELRAWLENISKLLAGDTQDVGVARDKAIPGVAYVAGSLKDTFGAVRTSLGLDSGSRTAQVAGKCAACGAPISGHTGDVVRCSYCDSDQQLQ